LVKSPTNDNRQWWPCPLCEARFESRGNLSNHARIHERDPPGGYTMPCRQCGAILRSETAVMQHMKAEHGQAKLECPHCGQAFERRTRLLKHIGTHRDLGLGIAKSSFNKEQSGPPKLLPESTRLIIPAASIAGHLNIPEPLVGVDFVPQLEPWVDQDNMCLLNPETRKELKSIELQIHLARVVLLLQTHTVTKQKFRMLGPDWIQLVDDQDIMRALELLKSCGFLAMDTAAGTSKGLAYNKVLPEHLPNSTLLARFNVSFEEYSQTFAR